MAGEWNAKEMLNLIDRQNWLFIIARFAQAKDRMIRQCAIDMYRAWLNANPLQRREGKQ